MIAYLIAELLSHQQASFGKQLQLAMQRAGRRPGESRDFPDMEPLFGPQEQKRENPTAICAKQQLDRRATVPNSWRSHIENKCSSAENTRQVISSGSRTDLPPTDDPNEAPGDAGELHSAERLLGIDARCASCRKPASHGAHDAEKVLSTLAFPCLVYPRSVLKR